jgi:hypothetical protein
MTWLELGATRSLLWGDRRRTFFAQTDRILWRAAVLIETPLPIHRAYRPGPRMSAYCKANIVIKPLERPRGAGYVRIVTTAPAPRPISLFRGIAGVTTTISATAGYRVSLEGWMGIS